MMINVCVLPLAQLVYSKQSAFLLWEAKWVSEPPACLQFSFSASFAPAEPADAEFKPYCYDFQLERVSVSPQPSSMTYFSTPCNKWCSH